MTNCHGSRVHDNDTSIKNQFQLITFTTLHLNWEVRWDCICVTLLTKESLFTSKFYFSNLILSRLYDNDTFGY